MKQKRSAIIVGQSSKAKVDLDGRGKARNNIPVERLWRSVKHGDVYLPGYSGVGDLALELTRYFLFHNGERPRQSLGNRTPRQVYAGRSGGGAKIVNRFGGALGQGSAVARHVKSWLQLEFRRMSS